jgi:hypothetical protein
MEHVKYYKNIKLPYDQLIRKQFDYANPTAQAKTIRVTSQCPLIKVKQERVKIGAYSSG